MSVFNNMLIAITAMVILATKLIELKLAIAKKKSETQTPTEATTHSKASKIKLPPRFFSDILLLIAWSFILIYMMISDSHAPVTRQDIAMLLVAFPSIILFLRHS